jgi:hypothetical protein
VLVDRLDYSQYSCDALSRAELLARIQKILLSGAGVLLRTARGTDPLDAKMLLRTIGNHTAAWTDSGFLSPPILPRSGSGSGGGGGGGGGSGAGGSASDSCMEMLLCPKKLGSSR